MVWGPGLGYANVPEGQVGWDGHWGTVAIQGPAPRPAGYVDPPEPHQIAIATVITEWICPACDADNDVWGEGAVYSWMECSSCGVCSFLQDVLTAVCHSRT